MIRRHHDVFDRPSPICERTGFSLSSRRDGALFRELRDEMSGKRHFKLPLCPNEVDLGRRSTGPSRGDLRQKAANAAKLR
jgi:hypothetical protein